MPSLDHIMLKVPTKSYTSFIDNYTTILKPLGIGELLRMGSSPSTLTGFGDLATKKGFIYILEIDAESHPVQHFALQTESRAQVDAFHAGALKAGLQSNGEPGHRPFGEHWYAAFAKDEMGNNVEVVCHAAPEK